MQLYHNYGVRHIKGSAMDSGIHSVFQTSDDGTNPETVQNIHNIGGSILSSSRGPQDIGEIVDCLERQDIRQLFVSEETEHSGAPMRLPWRWKNAD